MKIFVRFNLLIIKKGMIFICKYIFYEGVCFWFSFCNLEFGFFFFLLNSEGFILLYRKLRGSILRTYLL